MGKIFGKVTIKRGRPKRPAYMIAKDSTTSRVRENTAGLRHAQGTRASRGAEKLFSPCHETQHVCTSKDQVLFGLRLSAFGLGLRLSAATFAALLADARIELEALDALGGLATLLADLSIEGRAAFFFHGFAPFLPMRE